MNLRMISLLVLAAVLFALPGRAVAAKVSGTYTLDGKKYVITSVLAKTDENPLDEERKDIVVLLTDAPVTADQFNMGSLYRMSMDGKIHGIMATFNEDKECAGLVVLGITQRSGYNVCDFDPLQFDLTMISGKVSTTLQESLGHEYEFSIQFESAVTDAVEKSVDQNTGTPLPVGGGEPGKAYMEYDRAIQSGNIGVIKKFAPSEEAAKQLDNPEAKKMLQMMKAMRATGLMITKGFMDGNRATLIVEGKDSMSGGMATATVTMFRSGNQWKVVNESWKEQ